MIESLIYLFFRFCYFFFFFFIKRFRFVATWKVRDNYDYDLCGCVVKHHWNIHLIRMNISKSSISNSFEHPNELVTSILSEAFRNSMFAQQFRGDGFRWLLWMGLRSVEYTKSDQLQPIFLVHSAWIYCIFSFALFVIGKRAEKKATTILCTSSSVHSAQARLSFFAHSLSLSLSLLFIFFRKQIDKNLTFMFFMHFQILDLNKNMIHQRKT